MPCVQKKCVEYKLHEIGKIKLLFDSITKQMKVCFHNQLTANYFVSNFCGSQ